MENNNITIGKDQEVLKKLKPKPVKSDDLYDQLMNSLHCRMSPMRRPLLETRQRFREFPPAGFCLGWTR